jgi:hypothetical protein
MATNSPRLDIRRKPGVNGSALREKLFVAACLFAVCLPLILLAALFGKLFVDGLPRLSWEFLTSYPSRRADVAGILPAAVGTLYLIGLTALIALPIGVGAAIYLEEYGKKSRLAAFIEVNIANLAGVPSIIYRGGGVDARSAAHRAAIDPRDVPRTRRHPLADHTSSRAAAGDARRDDRLDLGRVARDGRDRPAGGGGRARVRAVSAGQRVRTVRRAANPDLQLGLASPAGVLDQRRGRHRRAAGHHADLECRRDHPP